MKRITIFSLKPSWMCHSLQLKRAHRLKGTKNMKNTSGGRERQRNMRALSHVSRVARDLSPTVRLSMLTRLNSTAFPQKHKGASIYDVRTEGGEGVPSKADIVSNLSKGGCMNLRTRGEGIKKSEIFADVLNGSPPGHSEVARVKGSMHEVGISKGQSLSTWQTIILWPKVASVGVH